MEPLASLDRPAPPGDSGPSSPRDVRPPSRPARTPFAHASEAELARILDYYGVAWEYEPHVFPILFDRSGAVLESFSPDFYLPELDLFLELTTLKQRLVRRKNRKLRRLRELYPGIRVKLLYARDFRALLFKYGRLALAGGMSGPEGQTTPPRTVVAGGAGRRDGTSSGEPPVRPQPAAPARVPGALTMAGGDETSAGTRRRARRTRTEARARAVARAAATEVTA